MIGGTSNSKYEVFCLSNVVRFRQAIVFLVNTATNCVLDLPGLIETLTSSSSFMRVLTSSKQIRVSVGMWKCKLLPSGGFALKIRYGKVITRRRMSLSV